MYFSIASASLSSIRVVTGDKAFELFFGGFKSWPCPEPDAAEVPFELEWPVKYPDAFRSSPLTRPTWCGGEAELEWGDRLRGPVVMPFSTSPVSEAPVPERLVPDPLRTLDACRNRAALLDEDIGIGAERPHSSPFSAACAKTCRLAFLFCSKTSRAVSCSVSRVELLEEGE